MKEKRRHRRFRSVVLMMYETKDPRLLETPINLDISQAGLQMLAKQDLPVGKMLRIMLAFSAAGRPLELLGKVVWNRKMHETERFRTGIEFLPFSSSNRDALRDHLTREDRRKSRSRLPARR